MGYRRGKPSGGRVKPSGFGPPSFSLFPPDFPGRKGPLPESPPFAGRGASRRRRRGTMGFRDGVPQRGLSAVFPGPAALFGGGPVCALGHKMPPRFPPGGRQGNRTVPLPRPQEGASRRRPLGPWGGGRGDFRPPSVFSRGARQTPPQGPGKGGGGRGRDGAAGGIFPPGAGQEGRPVLKSVEYFVKEGGALWDGGRTKVTRG